MEKVLLFNIDKENKRGKDVISIFEEMNIEILYANQNDLNQKVGYLFNLPGFERNDICCMIYLHDEVMVLYDFTHDRIKELFKMFYDRKVDLIALKASVTENNIHWDLLQLINELQQEKAFYDSYEVYHMLCKQITQMNIQTNDYFQALDLMNECNQLLKEQKLDTNQFKQYIFKLMDLQDKLKEGV